MQKRYAINVYRTSGPLYRMTRYRISFDSISKREEYDTYEEALDAFERCVADQGLERRGFGKDDIYYALYHSLEESEFELLEDGTEKIIDCRIICDNLSDLDLYWNGYKK